METLLQSIVIQMGQINFKFISTHKKKTLSTLPNWSNGYLYIL